MDVVSKATRRFSMRVLAFVVMPNHWHLLVWPTTDLQLSRFMHWLTMTHTQQWHRARGTTGTGPLYQGRYKAIPITTDAHFFTAARYVERNPVRAGLVDRVEEWRWSSAWYRLSNCDPGLLHRWPASPPDNWIDVVNEPQNQVHLSAVREAIRFNRPIGS